MKKSPWYKPDVVVPGASDKKLEDITPEDLTVPKSPAIDWMDAGQALLYEVHRLSALGDAAKMIQANQKLDGYDQKLDALCARLLYLRAEMRHQLGHLQGKGCRHEEVEAARIGLEDADLDADFEISYIENHWLIIWESIRDYFSDEEVCHGFIVEEDPKKIADFMTQLLHRREMQRKINSRKKPDGKETN